MINMRTTFRKYSTVFIIIGESTSYWSLVPPLHSMVFDLAAIHTQKLGRAPILTAEMMNWANTYVVLPNFTHIRFSTHLFKLATD